MEQPCTLFRPKNSLDEGLQLIRPDFCNWLFINNVISGEVRAMTEVAAVVAKVAAGERLNDASLTGLDFSGCDLHGAQLQGADLHGCNFSKANLREANLSRCNLQGADLRGANLYEADLHYANLNQTDFTGAKLRRANLTGSTRLGCIIKKWALKYAYIAGNTAYMDR